MKFELNFVDLKLPYALRKLIAWEESESEEDSETSAEDQLCSVTVYHLGQIFTGTWLTEKQYFEDLSNSVSVVML